MGDSWANIIVIDTKLMLLIGGGVYPIAMVMGNLIRLTSSNCGQINVTMSALHWPPIVFYCA